MCIAFRNKLFVFKNGLIMAQCQQRATAGCKSHIQGAKASQTSILPSPNLSVLDIVQSDLPKINHSSTTYILDTFFSPQPPSITDADAVRILWQYPLPHTHDVWKLPDVAREAWMNGKQSVLLPHIPGDTNRYPLFTITLWEWIVTHTQQERMPWRRVSLKATAKKTRTGRQRNLADRANTALSRLAALPWKLPNPNNHPHNQPRHYLHRLLGKTWTNSSVQNDLLDVLENKLEKKHGYMHTYIIQHVDFHNQLQDATTDVLKYHESGRWR
jgi:hypothetical protein